MTLDTLPRATERAPVSHCTLCTRDKWSALHRVVDGVDASLGDDGHDQPIHGICHSVSTYTSRRIHPGVVGRFDAADAEGAQNHVIRGTLRTGSFDASESECALSRQIHGIRAPVHQSTRVLLHAKKRLARHAFVGDFELARGYRVIRRNRGT